MIHMDVHCGFQAGDIVVLVSKEGMFVHPISGRTLMDDYEVSVGDRLTVLSVYQDDSYFTDVEQVGHCDLVFERFGSRFGVSSRFFRKLSDIRDEKIDSLLSD